MSSVKKANLDLEKIAELQQKIMDDLAALVGVACGEIGDRLGLYKAMSGANWLSSEELAEKTHTYERYVREWLINQAAGGYVEYDADTGKYRLSAEQAAVLADEGGDYFSAGGLQSFMGMLRSELAIADCFKTGHGYTWGQHDHNLFVGTERFFRTAYKTLLVQEWIPSLPGLVAKLDAGAKVADVGCGYGESTRVMARAFPKSQFVGYDNHAPSIEHAQREADREGLGERVHFVVSAADSLPESGFDMLAFFDCLHDMGNPEAACAAAAKALKPDGCLMIIEPMAGRTVQDNFNSVGRAFSGCSVLCCTPNAVASGGEALGTVATDDALGRVVKAGGFKHFARTAETPFNRVFAATK